LRVALAHVRDAPVRTACVAGATAACAAALVLVAAWQRPTHVDWVGAAAVVVLSAFIAADTGWLSGFDRRAEFSDMLRQGASKSQIAGLIASETVIAGSAGSVVGTASALAVVVGWGSATSMTSLSVSAAVALITSLGIAVVARVAATVAALRSRATMRRATTGTTTSRVTKATTASRTTLRATSRPTTNEAQTGRWEYVHIVTFVAACPWLRRWSRGVSSDVHG